MTESTSYPGVHSAFCSPAAAFDMRIKMNPAAIYIHWKKKQQNWNLDVFLVRDIEMNE